MGRRLWLVILWSSLISFILFSQSLFNIVTLVYADEELKEEEEKSQKQMPQQQGGSNMTFFLRNDDENTSNDPDSAFAQSELSPRDYYPPHSDYYNYFSYYAPNTYSSLPSGLSNPPNPSFPLSSFPPSSSPMLTDPTLVSSAAVASTYPLPFSSIPLLSTSPFSVPRESVPLPPPPPPLSAPLHLTPYVIAQQQQEQFFTSSSPQPQKFQEEKQNTKSLSPWFPSIPASDCQGTFEFTIEGLANLREKDLKSGVHKISLKLAADSPDYINGKLWIDKKNNDGEGYNFDVKKTYNNCKVVTASSLPKSSLPEAAPSSSELPNTGSSEHTSHEDLILSPNEITNEEINDYDSLKDESDFKKANKIAALD